MQSSQAVENTALCGKALIDSRNFEDGRKNFDQTLTAWTRRERKRTTGVEVTRAEP